MHQHVAPVRPGPACGWRRASRRPTGTSRKSWSTSRFSRSADVGSGEVGGQEAHAAVDVVAHAARRDDAVVDVEGRHAADGEAVAAVDVGHGQGVADDAGQVGHVGHLGEALVAAEGVQDELAVGVDAARHAHAPGLRELPDDLVHRSEWGGSRRGGLPSSSDVQDDGGRPSCRRGVSPAAKPVVGHRLDLGSQFVAVAVERLAPELRARAVDRDRPGATVGALAARNPETSNSKSASASRARRGRPAPRPCACELLGSRVGRTRRQRDEVVVEGAEPVLEEPRQVGPRTPPGTRRPGGRARGTRRSCRARPGRRPAGRACLVHRRSASSRPTACAGGRTPLAGSPSTVFPPGSWPFAARVCHPRRPRRSSRMRWPSRGRRRDSPAPGPTLVLTWFAYSTVTSSMRSSR